MSKSKNQKKSNNKPSNVPVKAQNLKPNKNGQKTMIKPDFNKKQVLKSNDKVNQKPMAKAGAKIEPMNNNNKAVKKPVVEKKNLKLPQKEVDIAESDVDEDEDDIEFEDDSDIDDSDIDDVDLGDSDDDDSDLSIVDMDSDLESIELNEDDIEDEEEEDEEELEKNENQKAVEKKEVSKPAVKKEVSKPAEKKEVPKPAEKKEVPKPAEKKEVPKPAEKKDVPKPIEKEVSKPFENKDEEMQLLNEINARKNLLSDAIVFFSKIKSINTKDVVAEILKKNNINAVSITFPTKMKSKVAKTRGYGFVRLVNSEEAKKVIELFNNMKDNENNITTSKYICKKVYDKINNVNFQKLIFITFDEQDMTETLKNQFKNSKVEKNLLNQYSVVFSKSEEAREVFNKKNMIVGGKKVLVNYMYSLKSSTNAQTPPVTSVDKKPVTVEAVKPVVEAVKPVVTVKAGIKRNNCQSDDCDSDDDVIVTKKIKVDEAAEKKVETPKKKIENERKVLTPQSNKKNFDKSPGNKQFNKFQGDKKPFNKSPGDKKQFNKSPGNKKQFNKSPGNKKFNK